MSRFKIAVLVIIATISVFEFWSFNLEPLCAYKTKDEIFSPSGELKALVYEADCGATTGFAQKVAILGAGESLEKVSGQEDAVFIADDDHGKSRSDIRVIWLSNSDLQIQYPGMMRTFRTDKTSKGVRIVYVAR